MKITDEMVNTACDAFNTARGGGLPKKLRATLEAVLAVAPETSAEQALQRVRELHENMDGECWECGPRHEHDLHPCETIEALEGK